MVLLLTAIWPAVCAYTGAIAEPQTVNNKHKETANMATFLIMFPPGLRINLNV
jgi:hypothetical protein